VALVAGEVIAFVLDGIGEVLLRDEVLGTVVSVASVPPEAYPPAVVDPDAVLTHSIACKLFQPVTRRSCQVLERLGCIEDRKFS